MLFLPPKTFIIVQKRLSQELTQVTIKDFLPALQDSFVQSGCVGWIVSLRSTQIENRLIIFQIVNCWPVYE